MGYLEYLSLLASFTLLTLCPQYGACAPIMTVTGTQSVSSPNTSLSTTSQSFTSTASDAAFTQNMIFPPSNDLSITSIISDIIGGGSDNTLSSQGQIISTPTATSTSTLAQAPTNTVGSGIGLNQSYSYDGPSIGTTALPSGSDSPGSSGSPTSSGSSGPSNLSDSPSVSEGSSGGSSNSNIGGSSLTLSNGVQAFHTSQADETSLLTIQTSISTQASEEKASNTHSAGSTAAAVVGTLAGLSLLLLTLIIWRRRRLAGRSDEAGRSRLGPFGYFGSQHHRLGQNSVDENGNETEKAQVISTGHDRNWNNSPNSPNSSISNSRESFYSADLTHPNHSLESTGPRLMVSTTSPTAFVNTNDGLYSPDPFRSKF